MTFNKTHIENISPQSNVASSLRSQAAYCQRNADRCRNTANPRDAQTWEARANQYRREAYATELASLPYTFETVLIEPRSLKTRILSWMRSL